MKKTLLLLVIASHPVWGGDLRIGRATVTITQKVGTPMGSSYGITVSTGVHDDLYAKALVLDLDGVRTAMVSCDLISIRQPIVAESRRLIEKVTGLRSDQVILSAMHCHAGPQMSPVFLALVPDAAPAGGAVRGRVTGEDCRKRAFGGIGSYTSAGVGAHWPRRTSHV